MPKPILVDLFSGCGGFGLGGELAGFHTKVAVDLDTDLQSAYRLNFPNTQVVLGDIGLMDEDAWRLILQGTQIDGVIGGPPCQGYSRIGRNDANDPRRSLLYHFYRTVNILQPAFFVMENVEGLLDKGNRGELDKAIELVDARYTVLDPIVLDASEFGAPTKRKRVVVIGYDPTFVENLSANDFALAHVSQTVRDAIDDLPSPIEQTKSESDYGWAQYRTDKNLSDYAIEMRTAPPEGLGWDRAITHLSVGQSSGHFETVHSDSVSARYDSLIPGTVDKVSRSKKLDWEGVCPTLRAGTGSDKGSYQAVRPIHPQDGRVITVREAARLQGFPDWFCFHPTKWHSFRMIGNSVSPIVSKQVLTVIRSKFVDNRLQQNG